MRGESNKKKKKELKILRALYIVFNADYAPKGSIKKELLIAIKTGNLLLRRNGHIS